MGRRTLAIIILIIGILMLVAVVVFFLLNQGQTDQPAAPQEGQVQLDENGQPISEAVTPVGESFPSELDLPIDLSGNQPAEGDQQMVEVVVSLQTIPRGWVMTAAELTTDLRFPADVGSNVITDMDEAIGLYARADIYQGQTLTKDVLVEDIRLIPEEEVGPSSLIPPGFVAQALPMDRLSSVAYGISEGDYVDILVSFILKEIDPQFQTLLENSITFYLRDEEGNPIVLVVDPYGRFEELPTGETTHIAPSEDPRRPILVSMMLQNAKVIQVGEWSPDGPIDAATPTPEPVTEDATPTPEAGAPPPTPTPRPPDTLLLALLPQDQLLLKYAFESDANIDFALRGVNDGQLYTIENVDFNYIKERFNIDIPEGYEYSVEFIDVTPTPISDVPEEETQPAPES